MIALASSSGLKDKPMLVKNSTQTFMGALCMIGLLTACGSDGDNKVALCETPLTPLTLQPEIHKEKQSNRSQGSFTLSILHINDHHSHLQPIPFKFNINNQQYKSSLGGFGRVAAKIEDIEANNPNTIRVHAGDAITGDKFYTLLGYKPDARVMNAFCFDVFALGNHEFDQGDQNLAAFLTDLKQGQCQQLEVLAANVIPQVGTPLCPTSNEKLFKAFSIKRINGHNVAFIGIDIAGKTKASSSPLPTTEFRDEIQTAQKVIDHLKHQGINKIVVVSHFQHENEVKMAKALKGVDVIVGGDSHTLLGGEDLKRIGLSPVAEYPVQVQNADGDPVCVVQAWEYAKVVGELKVSFDQQGKVTQCAGTPHLLLSETLQAKQTNGQWVDLKPEQLDSVKQSLGSSISFLSAQVNVQTIIDEEDALVQQQSNTIIGQAEETLCLARIPGRAYGDCDPAQLPHGSEIAEIVAEAFLAESKEAELALQNAGGVRAPLAKGDIKSGDVFDILTFPNTLVNMQLTGKQIKQVLEEAIDFALSGSDGAYPYAAGIRFNVDLSANKGKRVSQLEVKSKGQQGYGPIDVKKTYIVVLNSFIAAGKDGYQTLADLPNEDTGILYNQGLYNYIQHQSDQGEVIRKVAESEYSTQRLIH
jgi:5'-nucleotidase/UDP-sugar diphosphatase